MLALTPEQVDDYESHGYIAPIRVMTIGEAAALRKQLEDFERKRGQSLDGSLRHKTHLLFPWLNDLVRQTSILDAIEDLYGPDLLCWTTKLFIKEANDPRFVSWHQDSTYWGLSKPHVVTAWVAFTESTLANGAMQVIPGTHTYSQVTHVDTFAPNNLLTRGLEVSIDVDPSKSVSIELQPGEMSLHHVRIIHGSPANSSTIHRQVTNRSAKILYRGTNVDNFDKPENLLA